MPKNSLTILKDIYYSNLGKGLLIKNDGYVQEAYYGYSEKTETFSCNYGNGKIMFQYVGIHNAITIFIYNDANEEHHSYSKVVYGKNYKEVQEKMQKICDILLDSVYLGYDMSVIMPEIDKV